MKKKDLLTANENKAASLWSFVVVSGIMLAVFAVFAYLFPYTGDDWAWGSEIGLERLRTWFYKYNGRYLGNFLILAISRFKWLEVILMALSYYASCWLCYKYTPVRKTTSLLVATLLFFLMSRNIFSQAVVWASGYANYVPSALITVAYILMVSNITAQEKPEYKKFLWLPTFLMGFAGALFMENITLFNICLGIAVIGYVAIRFKKCYSVHIGFLLGAIGGAVLMFTNGAYASIMQGNDTYRKMPGENETMLDRCEANGSVICDYVFGYNYGLCVIISVLLLVLVIVCVKKNDFSKPRKAGVITAVSVNVLCTVAVCCRNLLMPESITAAVITVAVLYFASILTVVLLCVEKSRRLRMIFPLVCCPVSVLPLLVVSPIGPRCFYISYLLSMVFVVDLFGYLVYEHKVNRTIYKVLFGVLSVAAIVVVGIYLSIFVPIYTQDKKRNDFALLQSEQGEKKIVISALPDEGRRLWTPSPYNDMLKMRYKLFYGINEKAKIVVWSPEEFDEYYDKYMAELKDN